MLAGLTAVSNPVRFIAGDDLRAPYLIQSAIGVERQLTRKTTLVVNLTDTRGVRQFVTSNINAPNIDGVRPNPSAGDIYQFQSEGLLKQFQIITRVNSQIGSRFTLTGAYIWSTAHSNTDGGLCPSPVGCGTSTPVNQYDLNAEWGKAALDVQNRMFIFGSLNAPLKITLSPFIVASSGVPFNITTGGDYFNDGVLNARPAYASGPGPGIVSTPYGYLNPNPAPGEPLIPRNLGVGPGQFSLNLRLSRTFGFGTTKFAGSSGGSRASQRGYGGGRGGFGGFGGRGGPFGGGAASEHRYNLTLSVSARNLLNHVNYLAPVGIMGSPFFLQSTNINGGYGAEWTATDLVDFLDANQFLGQFASLLEGLLGVVQIVLRGDTLQALGKRGRSRGNRFEVILAELLNAVEIGDHVERPCFCGAILGLKPPLGGGRARTVHELSIPQRTINSQALCCVAKRNENQLRALTPE